MLYLILCYDKPDSLDLRLTNRSQHLDFVLASGDKVKIAGPILAEDEETMIGSMFVVEDISVVHAQAWNALDPYSRAGLFERVEIRPWKWLIGNPED